MLVDVPDKRNWRKHITNRFAEAVELGLFKPSIRPPTSGKLFVPDNQVGNLLSEIDPEKTSLRELTSNPKSAIEGGWIERPDLLDEASLWIIEQSVQYNLDWVVCQAGYQDVGDTILSHRDYITWKGAPLYYLNLGLSTTQKLVKTLRQGRSWRSLGIITDRDPRELYRPADLGIFFCDCLDGDFL